MEKMQKMAICVKKNRQTALYGRYNRAFHSFPPELFEGGDVDFLLAGVITFCRLILA